MSLFKLRRCLTLLRPHTQYCSFSSTNIKCSPTKVHLCDHPPSEVKVTKDEMISYYRDMIRIRRMEIAADLSYKKGLIRGFCHLYDGQEAIAVGLQAALNSSDHIITAYRCHAQHLLRGDTMKSIMCELMGKAPGCSKGKGGSMHLYDSKRRFYGGNGIVGAQIPVGAGIAFASKYRNDGSLCVAMYGDGAANQGQLFETVNMAALWKLPFIFLCENNRYGMGTAVNRAAFQTEFYKRGSYVPGIQCDGMDAISCRTTMEYAAEYCRTNGPIFVEMKTYRYHGHSMSDPGKTYRSPAEVNEYRKNRDSVLKAKNAIIELGWATEKELKTIDKEAKREADEATKVAINAPELDISERFTDIYYNYKVDFIRGTDRAKSFHASQ